MNVFHLLQQEQQMNDKGSKPEVSGSKANGTVSPQSGLLSPQIRIQSPSSDHVED